MKRSPLLILIIAVLALAACNDEVFIKPFVVEPPTNTLPWTGGEADFIANQEVESVWMTVFRWVNGRGLPVDEQGMQFSLFKSERTFNLRNQLCDLTFTLDPDGKFNISSGYNLFADTVYVNLEFLNRYESVERGFRLLPSPGFGHGEICYTLYSWQVDERVDTITLSQIVNPNDNASPQLTIRNKGDLIASRSAQFKPFDKFVSDNIFGRTEFEIDGIELKPPTWIPALSENKVTYTSQVQKLDGDELYFDEDVKASLAPHSWMKIKLAVNSTRYGIQYTLPAISPVEDLSDRTIEGIYWLSIPTDYKLIYETGEI